MASAKKNRSSLFPGWLGKLLAHLWGPGRPVATVLLLVAGFSCGTVVAWHQVRGRLLASGQYTVTLDKVAITPPPNWIHADIRAKCSAMPAWTARSVSSTTTCPSG